MTYTHVAAAIVYGLAAFAFGWQVQDWRYTGQINEMKAAQADAVNTATREARAQESARFKGVQDAHAAAQTRAQVARRDADRARSDLDRMRDTLNASRGGVPGESAAACSIRADTAGDVLSQCGAAYQELAGIADRLNADRLMLQEAWPK